MQQSFLPTFYAWAVGLALSLIVCTPDWPFYNRHPVAWLKEFPRPSSGGGDKKDWPRQRTNRRKETTEDCYGTSLLASGTGILFVSLCGYAPVLKKFHGIHILSKTQVNVSTENALITIFDMLKYLRRNHALHRIRQWGVLWILPFQPSELAFSSHFFSLDNVCDEHYERVQFL